MGNGRRAKEKRKVKSVELLLLVLAVSHSTLNFKLYLLTNYTQEVFQKSCHKFNVAKNKKFLIKFLHVELGSSLINQF